MTALAIAALIVAVLVWAAGRRRPGTTTWTCTLCGEVFKTERDGQLHIDLDHRDG